MLSQQWVSILKLNFIEAKGKKYIISRMIADAIAGAIKNKILLDGCVFPTNREIADHLNVSKNIVQKAWSILKNEYKLIVTQSGAGTQVVTRVSTIQKESSDKPSKSYVYHRGSYFNREYLSSTDGNLSIVHKEMVKGYDKHAVLLTDHNKITVLNDLIVDYAMVINNALCTQYKENEVYYSQSYQQVITHTCSVVMYYKKIFVMADTASSLVRDAVEGAGFKVELVNSDAEGILMEGLEEILKKGNVKIVYVRSRSAFPYKQILNEARINRLRELQESYKFIIIEDDRYASYHKHKPNLLMQAANHESIIYLRPASRLHSEMYKTILIAAPSKIVNLIRNRCRKIGKAISMEFTCTIRDLMKQKKIQQFEAKMSRYVNNTIKKTREVLMESGIWEEEGILGNQGCIFYLRLKNGILPEHIFELLAKENIHLMNAAEFVGSGSTNGTIVISVLGYADDNHLEGDLTRFNSFFEK